MLSYKISIEERRSVEQSREGMTYGAFAPPNIFSPINQLSDILFLLLSFSRALFFLLPKISSRAASPGCRPLCNLVLTRRLVYPLFARDAIVSHPG